MTTPSHTGRITRPLALARGALTRGVLLALLGALTLPALLPLFRPGFFISDDGRFHVYRIAALADAWRHGILHPRLFPEFGFGYGQAVLNFYAPLTYWPAAAATLLGFDPAQAAQIAVALGFLLAAFAAFGYIRWLWGPWAGLIAAAVYTYFPYHLADAYTRGAIPEHWAFIFPPLILWAYTAAFRTTAAARSLLWGTLAWAGLVLTHNLTALMMAPVAAAHLLLMAAWTGRWRRLLPAIGSLALAIGMTAAYWLPVLGESNSVGISLGPSRGYENHLLAAGQLLQRSLAYLYRDQNNLGLVYPLSWLTLVLLILGILLLLWRRRHPPAHTPLLILHLLLALGAIFLTSTASLWLWRPLTPLLGHLQYPWRFHVLVALGLMAAAGALPVLWPRLRPVLLLALIFVASVFTGLARLPLQPLPLPAAETWSPERMWREDAEVGQVGATWTAEFLPLTVAEQRWALSRPRVGATDGPPPEPIPTIILSQRSYDAFTLHLTAAHPFPLRLHQFHLPGWNAAIDGRPAPTYPSNELGLVTVNTPAGSHDISIGFGATPYRIAGAMLSALALVIWVALVWLRARPHRLLLVASLLLLLLTLALGLNSLGLGQRAWAPHPAQSRLSDVALLIGRDAHAARGDRALDVTLYWVGLRDTASNYKAFVHLVDGQGRVVAQHDGDPVGGFSPTTRWRAGELIPDTHRLPLPPDLPPGSYGLKAGLYELTDAPHNLTTDPPTPDNRVDLGKIDAP